ncbi:P-loop containing nucleoside triphosphate hydrolase protein [Usnea florida]
MDEIAGCQAAKAAIEAAAYILSQWPHLLDKGYGCKNILLHGSPGTGKSTLALALAAESKLPVYNVSSSHLVDRWVGSSEKNARALFEIAASKAPSVIVFDEADAICGSRRPGSNDGAQRMINELLACMTKYPHVVVIGTTSLPWTLDVDFVRRFAKDIQMALPSEIKRREIFDLALDKFPHSLSPEHVIRAASESGGFTGDAIQRCVESAAELMAMKLRSVTHFRSIKFHGQECYLLAMKEAYLPRLFRDDTWSSPDLSARKICSLPSKR